MTTNYASKHWVAKRKTSKYRAFESQLRCFLSSLFFLGTVSPIPCCLTVINSVYIKSLNLKEICKLKYSMNFENQISTFCQIGTGYYFLKFFSGRKNHFRFPIWQKAKSWFLKLPFYKDQTKSLRQEFIGTAMEPSWDLFASRQGCFY